MVGFGLVCLFVLFVVWLCGVGFVCCFACFTGRYLPIFDFHTEAVKLSLVISEEGTRPCFGDTMSFAFLKRFFCSSGLPVSPRSAAACEEKKTFTQKL